MPNIFKWACSVKFLGLNEPSGNKLEMISTEPNYQSEKVDKNALRTKY